MKIHLKTASLCFLAATSLAFHPGSLHAATIIYADAFPGSSVSPLNGTTPATESGTLGGSAFVTWSALTQSANTVFKADGSVSVSGSTIGVSAVLPFTPQTGQIYTLSATVNAIASSPSDWIALGFEEINAASQSFISNNGYAWMIERGGRGTGSGQVFLGPGVGGSGFYDTSAGPLTLGIVLNTGAANWTAQFFLNGSALGAPTAYSTNPTINFVGFSELNTAAGNVDNFSLTATSAPEPASAALLGLGTLLLAAHRRRSAHA